MSPYPILSRQSLRRVQSRRLLPRRRELSELPEQAGGTVLVATVDGEYVELVQSRLTPTTESWVHATSIAVVDTRPTLVEVELEIPSATVGLPFVVRVTFDCKVTDPLAVAAGRDDISAELIGHLTRDDEVMTSGRHIAAADLSRFEPYPLARITAWCSVRPLLLMGMTIKLSRVSVKTDAKVIDHAISTAQRQRDRERAMWEHEDAVLAKRRAQELRQMQSGFSIENAKAIEVVLNRGPEAIEALFLELDDERYATSAERAYTQREITESRLRELIGMLAERGHLDRVNVDTPRLMNEFVDGLLASRTKKLDRESRSEFVVGASPVAGSVGAGLGDGLDELEDRPSDLADDLSDD